MTTVLWGSSLPSPLHPPPLSRSCMGHRFRYYHFLHCLWIAPQSKAFGVLSRGCNPLCNALAAVEVLGLFCWGSFTIHECAQCSQ